MTESNTSRPKAKFGELPPMLEDALDILVGLLPADVAVATAGNFDHVGAGFNPAAETVHDANDFVVRMELAGVAADSLNVELLNNRLIVSGEKVEPELAEGEVKRVRELRYGSFKRGFGVPAKVAAEDVEADFTNGVLTVRVRDAFKKPEGIKINVES